MVETPSVVEQKQQQQQQQEQGEASEKREHKSQPEEKGNDTKNQTLPHKPVPHITDALRRALSIPRDRTFIVKLEKDLQSFIMSNTDSYLLAPMNSYYRLITHQTAEYYCLGHTLNEGTNSILVFKHIGVELTTPTPLSTLPIGVPYTGVIPVQYCYPQNMYQQFPLPVVPQVGQVPQQQHQHQQQYPQTTPSDQNITTAHPSQHIKIMKRDDSKNKAEDSEGNKNEETTKEGEEVETDDTKENTPQSLISDLASRELEYQKARERIFADDQGSSTESSPETSPVVTNAQPFAYGATMNGYYMPDMNQLAAGMGAMGMYYPQQQQQQPLGSQSDPLLPSQINSGGQPLISPGWQQFVPVQYYQGQQLYYPGYAPGYPQRGGYNQRGGYYKRRGHHKKKRNANGYTSSSANSNSNLNSNNNSP